MKYLAIGDSYTIGEQVPAEENFPNQVYLILRGQGYRMAQPRIIAVTGWTTDELEEGIKGADLVEKIETDQDLVTLLIGVNDQYRGRKVEEYHSAFEELLLKAVRFADNEKDRVIVLSIPDWGVTPFAEGRDREQIAKEIDQYNQVNKSVTEKHHIYYIDVTAWTREAAKDPSLLTSDGLHPSGKEYKRWAEKIAARAKKIHPL